jgi:hypothetical protein
MGSSQEGMTLLSAELDESPVAVLGESSDRDIDYCSTLAVVIPSSESDRSLEGISDNETDTAVLVSIDDIERELLSKNSLRGCKLEQLTPKGCKSKFRRHKIPPPGQYPLNFSPYQMCPRQLNFHAIPRCHTRLALHMLYLSWTLIF